MSYIQPRKWISSSRVSGPKRSRKAKVSRRLLGRDSLEGGWAVSPLYQRASPVAEKSIVNSGTAHKRT